jgi:D-erythro-7,8-dihydroneopterin triphosphate epimerase
MGQLSVTNMFVRSHIGFDPKVEDHSQDLLVDITISYNSYIEEESDNPDDSFDIQQLISEIIGRAENSHFNLIEAFARMVLNTILEFKRVEEADVKVTRVKALDNSGELSFALSGLNR